MKTKGPSEGVLAGAAVLGLAAALLSVPVSASAQDSELTIRRLAAADRIGTAVELSRAGFQTSDSVVIASAATYADALTGGPLAAHLEAPLLLSEGDRLSAATRAEVGRLGARRAVLLGGPNALSEVVAEDMARTGIEVVRVAGADRFETAARIAGLLPPTGRAFAVEGASSDPSRGWPDAVSAAGVAAREGRAILLVTSDRVPDSTLAAVRSLGVEQVDIVGGPAAVGARAERELADTVRTTRTFGLDRYGTSRAVVDRFAPDLAGGTGARLWLATGGSWPDALAAGPASAAAGANLMLVDGRRPRLGLPAASFLDQWSQTAQRDSFDEVVVVGGENAVSEALVTAVSTQLVDPDPLPTARDEVRGDLDVVIDAEGDATGCIGSNSTDPPTCGEDALTVQGLAAEDLPFVETDGEISFGRARFTGRFEGEALTLTGPPEVAPACLRIGGKCPLFLEDLSPAQQTEVSRVQGDSEALRAVRDHVESQDDFAYLAYTLPPEPVGLRVGFAGTTDPHVDALRAVWPHPLSVVRTERTETELVEVQRQIDAGTAELTAEGIIVVSTGLGDTDRVDVEVRLLTEDVRSRLEDRFGPGALSVTSAFTAQPEPDGFTGFSLTASVVEVGVEAGPVQVTVTACNNAEDPVTHFVDGPAVKVSVIHEGVSEAADNWRQQAPGGELRAFVFAPGVCRDFAEEWDGTIGPLSDDDPRPRRGVAPAGSYVVQSEWQGSPLPGYFPSFPVAFTGVFPYGSSP